MNQAHDLNERYVNTYAAPVQQTAVHRDMNICPKELLKGLNWKKTSLIKYNLSNTSLEPSLETSSN